MSSKSKESVSVILAAGRGSRMKGYEGNKALLPLVPGQSRYTGTSPIIMNILKNLPKGPKAIVVNHGKEEIMEATGDLQVSYCEQPVLNGTGGALLAARQFIRAQTCEHIIITMGDVPFVKRSSFESMIEKLGKNSLIVLSFRPESKKQYGVLEIEGERVRGIIEWKYWSRFPDERIKSMSFCNSGIYAAGKELLLEYLDIIESRPHLVRKEVDGEIMEFEEFFITDMVEYMNEDGLAVGYLNVENESEVMGIDDPEALEKAQAIFAHQLPR